MSLSLLLISLIIDNTHDKSSENYAEYVLEISSFLILELSSSSKWNLNLTETPNGVNFCYSALFVLINLMMIHTRRAMYVSPLDFENISINSHVRLRHLFPTQLRCYTSKSMVVCPPQVKTPTYPQK